jgi:hypothetical protein
MASQIQTSLYNSAMLSILLKRTCFSYKDDEKELVDKTYFSFSFGVCTGVNNK